jgi:hypothetical protein
MKICRCFTEPANVGADLVARHQNAVAVVSGIFDRLGCERCTQLLKADRHVSRGLDSQPAL